ncbi:sensor histidine kinase [Craterilacuibacter sp.]|uniref:sensor histidine kinase n=1 Tax=Craterilacuibacter sp. TaxID=2870909 RepID=UPI003F38AA82
MTDKVTGASEKYRLEQAFAQFNQVSGELIGAYQLLEDQLAVLNSKLAEANNELLRRAAENEALAGRLSLLLESLPAGVVEISQAGRVVMANPAAGEMLSGLALDEDWSEVQAAGLQPTGADDTFQVCSGTQCRRVQIQQCVLPDGVLLLLHDVTRLHQLHDALATQEKLASMGRMAASLAHQLRTPLATAMLYAANLQHQGLPDSERQRFSGKIIDRLRALEGLIQNMLGFVRTSALQEPVLLAELFDELEAMIRPQSEQCQLVLSCVRAPDLKVVLSGERKALLSSWVALAENALAHTPAGGQLALTLEACGHEVCFSVADSGAGVSEEIRERIFEPFFSGRVGGTGLGLSIVKKVADEMGGQIEVGRSIWGGARFEMRFNLPAPAALGNA